MENFFREIYNTDHFVAVTFSMLEEITVAPVASVSSLQDISDTVYKKTVPVDVVFTTSTYNKIYNLPIKGMKTQFYMTQADMMSMLSLPFQT